MWSYRSHFLLEIVKGDLLTHKKDSQLPIKYLDDFFCYIANDAVWWTLRKLVAEVVFRFLQLMDLEAWKKTLKSARLKVTIKTEMIVSKEKIRKVSKEG